ncbi:MAG TPA: alpha/beta fold hydrolase [Planctomycetota bacterium]|nr:alpha/beta fold hydrolase [Planctomycetota bacterium]
MSTAREIPARAELSRSRKILRRLGLTVAIAFAIWLGLGAWTAFELTRAVPSRVEPLAQIGARPVENLEVRAADGVRSVAWFADAGTERCAVLLSGIRTNRRGALPRADFWLARGWSVLLPDLRGTGESDPRPISFGWNARLDVEAWVAHLRARGVRTIALHGQSLGAAAAVYAAADGTQVELLVVDACYDNLRNALSHRLPWIPLPHVAFLSVRAFTELRVHASLDALQPVECVRRIRVPTFFAAGTQDQKVGREASEALLRASAAPHKTLHWLAGADHEELWIRDPVGLALALDAFLRDAGFGSTFADVR